MADLLGSILSSMEKPPSLGDQETRRKARGEDPKFTTAFPRPVLRTALFLLGMMPPLEPRKTPHRPLLRPSESLKGLPARPLSLADDDWLPKTWLRPPASFSLPWPSAVLVSNWPVRPPVRCWRVLIGKAPPTPPHSFLLRLGDGVLRFPDRTYLQVYSDWVQGTFVYNPFTSISYLNLKLYLLNVVGPS